jgi:hypothetical protein
VSRESWDGLDSEAKFGVSRFEIAKARTAAEIRDDVKTLL